MPSYTVPCQGVQAHAGCIGCTQPCALAAHLRLRQGRVGLGVQRGPHTLGGPPPGARWGRGQEAGGIMVRGVGGRNPGHGPGGMAGQQLRQGQAPFNNGSALDQDWFK